MRKKSIVSCLLLTIVTCGLYGIYWFYQILNDVSDLSLDQDISPLRDILVSIITCGIYSIYLNYKIGKIMYDLGNSEGVNIADNSIMYLILSVLGFSIVNYMVIQNDINKFAL